MKKLIPNLIVFCFLLFITNNGHSQLYSQTNAVINLSGNTPATKWVTTGVPLITGYGEQASGNADQILAMASTLQGARPVILGRRSRGTLAAPAVVAANDYVVSFLASGYDGSGFQNTAAIDFYVDGTPSVNNVPIRLSLVTEIGRASCRERVCLAV